MASSLRRTRQCVPRKALSLPQPHRPEGTDRTLQVTAALAPRVADGGTIVMVSSGMGELSVLRPPAGVAPRSFAFWSQARVIDELRRIHVRGRVRITNHALRAAGYQGLLSAIYVRIGSVPRARRLAMIPDPGYRPPDEIHRWNEDSVIGEIRARYRSKQSLASTKVPLTLLAAADRYCGNWQAAIEMAGFDYESIRLHRRAWTREELIAKVRAAVKSRARSTDAPSLSKLVVSYHRAIQRLFGGLRGALLAAGIDPASVQKRAPSEWSSNAALIDALRAYVARTPPPTSGQLFRSRLGRQAVFRFGSREAVIRKIGVGRWSPQRSRPVPDADEVVRWLQARHRAGRHMSCDAANVDAPRFVRACYRRFGSWRAAMQAAGLGKLIGGGAQLTSRKEVVRALRERHRHGLPMALKRATRERPRLVRAACAQFGTWQAALRAAGLGEVPEPRALLSPQEVMQELQARHRRGRPMTAVATLREKGKLVYAACRHFGTWKAAMRAAGLGKVVDASYPLPSPSAKDVVRMLQARHRRGHDMSCTAARRDDGRLERAAYKHYGSWRAAMTAAGLSAFIRRQRRNG